MSLVDTLVAGALECKDLSFGNRATQRAYLLHQYRGDVDASGEPNAAAKEMGKKQYGCLLHCRGVLGADETDGMMVYRGKTIDILRCAYAPLIGQIETMMKEFARARGLLVEHDDQDAISDIQPGDILLIGERGSAPEDAAEHARWVRDAGGVAHGVFVTGVEGDTITSVDGGGSDPLNPPYGSLIRQCVRTVNVIRGKKWLGDRRISWRLRSADLPLAA